MRNDYWKYGEQRSQALISQGTAFLSQMVSICVKYMLFLFKWKEIDFVKKIRLAINLALWKFVKKNIVLTKQKKAIFSTN